MTNVDISRLVPRFIMNDRNGRALAKAIEAGLNDFLGICDQGVKCVSDPENMPEWRLDEMAWEYNIPYDYDADISVKRGWIKDAYALSRLYGTADGIAKYIGTYFEGATVQEAADYNGDPFHFKVILSGVRNVSDANWALAAANAIKNVRSALDEMLCDLPVIETNAAFYAGAALYGAVGMEMINDEQPDIDDIDWIGDESDELLSDERNVGLTD